MSDERYKLKLRKEIAQIERDLAEDAQRFIDCCKIYGQEAGMEENQIRNLLQISEETGSLEAIESFIRYQIGRSSAWRFKPKGEQETFGEALISKIGQLRVEHGILVQELAEDIGRGEAEVFWHFVRLYLGYMNWCFVYRKKSLSEPE